MWYLYEYNSESGKHDKLVISSENRQDVADKKDELYGGNPFQFKITSESVEKIHVLEPRFCLQIPGNPGKLDISLLEAIELRNFLNREIDRAIEENGGYREVSKTIIRGKQSNSVIVDE